MSVCSPESEVEIELPIQVDGMLLLPEKLNYQFYSLTLQDLDNISGHHFKGDLLLYSYYQIKRLFPLSYSLKNA